MQSVPSFLTILSLALLTLLGAGQSGDPCSKCCNLRHYLSLDPKMLAAVIKLKDLYEQEMLTWERRNCSFSRQRESRKISPCTRLHLLAIALENTETVLLNLSRPNLATSTRPVLKLLSALRRDVAACVICRNPESPVSHSTPAYDQGTPRELSHLAETSLSSRRPKAHPTTKPWTRGPQEKLTQSSDFDNQVSPSLGKLEGVDQRSSKSRRKNLLERRLHKAKRLESPQCREAETVLTLLKLLTFDLKLAILSGSCN